MKIIGIAGTNGSGKDTIGHMLAERHNYLLVSVTDLLREEAKRRNLPVEREYLRTISAEWRREHGLGVLVDRAAELWESQKDKYQGVVAVSMRNSGEVERIHELGGKVIWVDSDPKIRYDRIQKRKRTEEDNKTFEQFLAEEEAEMYASGDAATLNMAGVKALCDVFIQNNETDIKIFKDKAEEALKDVI